MMVNARFNNGKRIVQMTPNDKSAPSPSLLSYPVPNGLRAFSTMRQGGCSEGSYASFNVTHYCGDDPAAVHANRLALCRLLNIDGRRLVLPHQTHSSNVLTIEEQFFALPKAEQTARLESVDALVTTCRKVCIGISTADCVPILLYAPTADGEYVIAAAHAGWRGTVAQIAARTVEAMTNFPTVAPQSIHAIIGPSISAEAFEVGDEVYEAFRSAAAFPMDAIARRQRGPSGEEKWHIDLWAANVATLETAGLQLENISVAGICSYTNVDQFFSARRLGINSGRIYSGILVE